MQTKSDITLPRLDIGVKGGTMNVMKRLALIVFALLLLAVSTSAFASHSWGGYHWARTANPFTIKLGDNVSSSWDSYLGVASSDWSQSGVLDTTIVPGGGGKSCRPTSGRIEVCNKKYGKNGWLGLAQIWITGGEHITQGTAKINDTYFSMRTYNTPAWKKMVMCQEIGHGFGLDHKDENFNNPNLGTCMDYTSDPDGPPSNEHPNAHDFEMLETIYAHPDSFSTVDESTSSSGRGGKPAFVEELTEDPGSWGQKVKDNGHVALFVRDFGGGNKVLTYVIWAKE